MTKSSLKGDDGDNKETQKPHATMNMACKPNNDESIDGMTIEDWLANHHEMIPLSLPPSIIEENTNGSANPCDRSRTLKITPQPSHINDGIARMSSHISTFLVNNNNVVTERDDDDDDFKVPVVEATNNYAEPTVMTNGDILVPVLYTTTVPKEQLLIEGVNVAHTKCRRIYLVTGCLVLATVVAFAVTIIATSWLVHSGQSHPNLGQVAPENNATTISPTGSRSNQGNTNWTIADAIIDNSKNGNGFSLVQIESGLWFLQSVLNNTDVNLTYFQVSQTANLLKEVESSLIFKFTFPLWNGHTVSGNFLSYYCSYCSGITHTHTMLSHAQYCRFKC
jgi:hypothetical protein